MEPQSFPPQPKPASADTDSLAVSLSLPVISAAASVTPQPRIQSPPVGAIENVESVLAEFELLSERVSTQNLFSEPEWLNASVKAFEPSSEVLALTARRYGRLTGILPLVRTFEQWGCFPARVLRPPAHRHYHSFEILREEGASGTAALRAMFSMLDSVEGWDVMELPRLPLSGNTTSELLSLAREKGWLAAKGASATNLFVELKPGVGKKMDAPWLSKVTTDQRKTLRYAEQLVTTKLDGWICFETIARPTNEQLGLFFQTESSGWKGAHKSAILSSNATRTFYSEIARSYARKDRFMLNLLILQDQVAAGQIGIRTGNSFCALKMAYDERFSQYSPCSLLLNSMLRLCWEKSLRKVELGPESQYKRRWASGEAQLASYFLFRPGFYGRLLYDYKFLARPRLKQALTRLRLSSGAE